MEEIPQKSAPKKGKGKGKKMEPPVEVVSIIQEMEEKEEEVVIPVTKKKAKSKKKVDPEPQEEEAPVVEEESPMVEEESPMVEEETPKKTKAKSKKKSEPSVEEEEKKRGRKPKPKEQVYVLKDALPYELDQEKSETLILHLPIKSADLEKSNHPTAFQTPMKQPMATYSIDGTIIKNEESPISYQQILQETVVEKKDYVVLFENDDFEEPVDSNLTAEFDKKVKEFKEFKLGNYITQVSKEKKVEKEDKSTKEAHDLSGLHTQGTLLKELDEQASVNVYKRNPFMESSHIDEDIIQEHSNKMNKKNLKNIMVEFMNANMYHEWPDQTNIHCWWCCHQFEGPPCCLPEYMRRDKFYVSGCFCTFNCAASYNFHKNDNLVWERYTLLNLMYKKLYNTNFSKIEMAPPREALKMFGGYMSIEEFRDHCIKQDRAFQVVKPPMISIIPKIEENLHSKQRSVNENILQSTQSKLKLTRTKPLIAEKSSIQTFMNITRSPSE